ncbi:hypothetical protein CCR96_05860 [Halochromatium roseum]|nr:hypothetical protein [Halochromatium roseum]
MVVVSPKMASATAECVGLMQGTRALHKGCVAMRHGRVAARDCCWPMMMLAVAVLIPRGADAGDDDAELARHLLSQGRILPLEQFLTRAQSVRPGIPVEVELHAEDDPHRYVYEIEMLDPDGAVWSIVFDARTGQLIDVDGDED